MTTRDQHQRRSIRLRDFDYSQAGAYFVTIATKDRACLFGEMVDQMIRLNHYGEIIRSCWDDLPNHYPHVELDEFAIMPNHMHGVIAFNDPVGAGLKPAPTTRHPLSEIVRAFKTFSARRINELRNTQGNPVWQRNYYEHVIRNDNDLNRIRQYIIENPMRWADDEENPNRH